jgi:Tfp pilus assembly protein PilX
MSTKIRDERGWAVVTAIFVMTLMVSLGLASFAFVDTETRQSGNERVNESSFNLSEGALGSQAFVMAGKWPGSASTAWDVNGCSSSGSAKPEQCPDVALMNQAYATQDYAAATSWSTIVRDNITTNPTFYDETVVNGLDTYDSNQDDKVWVRSSATVRGKKRTIVALVQAEKVVEPFPRSVLIAGSFATTNTGNKTIVDTNGVPPDEGSTGPVQVRCTTTIAQPGDPCLGYEPGKDQIQPEVVQQGYPAEDAMTEDAIDRLRARAFALNAYYPAGQCPANPSGQLIFIEDADCAYNNSIPGPCCNTASNPGAIIVNKGTLSFTGNIEYYGVLYMHNAQDTSGPVVTLSGTVSIIGGVNIDGNGRLDAGSSKINLIYSPIAFDNFVSYGTTGVVQNTWREVHN